MIKRLLTCLMLLAAITGCSVNPVTGRSEITLVGEESEIQMGEQNYLPMQQSQGGDYDIDPVLTEYVQGVGNKLAAVSDRPLPYEFVVLNNSVPNAWALPGGKIAVNRGLLTELDSEAELAAVLGHEIVHAAARHSARQMERGMLMQGLVLATAVATSDSDYGNVAVGGASFAGQLLTLKYSRDAELEADRYGMEYMQRAGYDPQGAVSLQEAFVRLSEEEGRQSGWLNGLFASHPPSQERVDANIATAARLTPGGLLGGAQYEEALERTTEVLPAYAAYDEGRKALAEKNTELAKAKAEEAIAILPEEGHFYALRGDARILDEQYDMAVTNFDNAISRRDDFFYYYLQRGRAYERLGNDDNAVRDLQKSLEFLPTGPAHYTLGNIAAKRGDRAAAVEHFRVVAAGQGEMAEAAQASLVRLDIGQNPAAYLLTRCDPDAKGELVVSIKNNTTVPVTDLQLSVQFRDSAGVPRRIDRRLRGRMDGGEIVSIQTGLGPYTAGSACPAQITSARVAD